MSMGFGMHSVMADTEKSEPFCCCVFALFKHDLKCTPVKQGKFNKDTNFVVEKTKQRTDEAFISCSFIIFSLLLLGFGAVLFLLLLVSDPDSEQ